MKEKIFIYTIILTVIFSVVFSAVIYLFDRSYEADVSNYVVGWWSGLFYMSCKDYFNKELKN